MLDSQYEVSIVHAPNDGLNWDLTIGNEPMSATAVAAQPRFPYGSEQSTTIKATLHQYDICEERVVFHDLDIGPLAPDSKQSGSMDWTMGGRISPRYLMLKQSVTATTPSGITITLPVQGAETLDKVFSSFIGNPNALFIQIHTSPDRPDALLPQSLLFKEYGRRVKITLGVLKPDLMVFYLADNTYQYIAIDLPNLKTVMHLNTLTLIVRQRVDLQSIPVSFQVPIDRDVK